MTLAVRATAASAFPAQLEGTLASADSLFAGTEAQGELHLAADGFGIMAGSTPTPVRLDGVKDGKPAPRGNVGFPLQAQMEGALLMLQFLQPQDKRFLLVPKLVMVCLYKPEPATLI